MSDFNLYDGNNSGKENSNSYYDPEVASQTRQTASFISGTSATRKGLFGSSSKSQAFRNNAELNSMQLSDQMYYGAIGAFLLWGLGVNFLLVKLFGNGIATKSLPAITIAYVICAIVGIVVQMKSKTFVGAFIGYNLLCVPLGLVIAAILPQYSSTVVSTAIIGTVLISALMMIAGFIFPNVFEKVGGAIAIGLFVGLIADLILVIFFRANVIVLEYFFLVLFALYIGFDMGRAAHRPRTIRSAVDIAIDLYLDIINIFFRLLIILSDSKR